MEVEEYKLNALLWNVNPRTHDIRVVEQKDNQGEQIDTFLTDNSAQLSINGGFFEIDQERRLTPSGLLVSDGQTKHEKTEVGGSGIFYLVSNRVGIIKKDLYNEPNRFFQQALQAGPMLIDPGPKMGIYTNDFNGLNRSAICLRGNIVTFLSLIHI